MRVLVTGASGHIASFLIPTLLKHGYSVRSLVRPGSNTSAIASLDTELVIGDILDEASVRSAMERCEAVFHLAAPTRNIFGTKEAILSGTQNVFRAAAANGVSSVVYTSSIVTVGYSNDPATILDETSRLESQASPYHSAKFRAEEHALTWAHQGLFKVIVVNPATVVGPMDFRITPSNEAIHRALKKGLKFTFDSGLTIAPVQDVARGHLLALLHGRSGERYILGGEQLTIDNYFRLITDCCEKPKPRWHLPKTALLGAGLGFSAWTAISKRPVPFTLTQARTLIGKYGFYSSEKARTELGYSWRSAKEAVLSFIQWTRSSYNPPG